MIDDPRHGTAPEQGQAAYYPSPVPGEPLRTAKQSPGAGMTPILGYLTAATAPARIPTLFLGVIPVPHIVGTDPAWFAVLRQLHLALALLLVVLAFGHTLMALHHHQRGGRVLARMWRG
jgi:hypothetical protein